MTDETRALREWEEAGILYVPGEVFRNRYPLRHTVHHFGGHTGGVEAVAVTPDGRLLLTGSDDGTARLWDLQSGRCLQTFAGHTGEVSAVAVTPDGRFLVTGSPDGTVRFWDLATGNLLAILYHVDRGYLWATPATPCAPSGWLHTDREDLIAVVRCPKEGPGELEVLPEDDPDRRRHLKVFNRRDMVLGRLRASWEEIEALERALEGRVRGGLAHLPGELPRLGGRGKGGEDGG